MFKVKMNSFRLTNHGVFKGRCSLFPKDEKRHHSLKYFFSLFCLPSFAKPKSVNFNTASSSFVVKSKFSGFRSPKTEEIRRKRKFSFSSTHDAPKKIVEKKFKNLKEKNSRCPYDEDERRHWRPSE